MLKIKAKRKKKSMNFQSPFLGETIKTTAMSKNQEMHYEIKDLDLICKEFKYHYLVTRSSLVGTVQNVGQILLLAFITKKHFLVALGLHDLTVRKKSYANNTSVRSLNKLWQVLSNRTCTGTKSTGTCKTVINATFKAHH